jgi:hypothetical protein
MNFKEAMDCVSGLLDMYYEEYCSSGIETEDYEALEKAETILCLLVKELESKGITNLKELKEN